MHREPGAGEVVSESDGTLAETIASVLRAEGERLTGGGRWDEATPAVVAALRALPVEERMEAMGMKPYTYTDSRTWRAATAWVEA